MEAIEIKPSEEIPGLGCWTWAKLEAAMLSLAASEASRAMVKHLVGGLRAMAPWLGDLGIRREIAAIFSALADPSFPSAQTPTTDSIRPPPGQAFS